MFSQDMRLASSTARMSVSWSGYLLGGTQLNKMTPFTGIFNLVALIARNKQVRLLTRTVMTGIVSVLVLRIRCDLPVRGRCRIRARSGTSRQPLDIGHRRCGIGGYRERLGISLARPTSRLSRPPDQRWDIRIGLW